MIKGNFIVTVELPDETGFVIIYSIVIYFIVIYFIVIYFVVIYFAAIYFVMEQNLKHKEINNCRCRRHKKKILREIKTVFKMSPSSQTNELVF